MMRGGLTLLPRRPPLPLPPFAARSCVSKMGENTLPICPKFQSFENGDTTATGLRFRLVSYNILAQVYVKSSFFPHSPSPCLRWKARSQTILTVLKGFEADFLCLQEVDEFDTFYKEKMESCGYLSCYIQRTGQKRDGCGIFYKPGSAELLLKEEIEYNDLVNSIVSNENSTDTDVSADIFSMEMLKKEILEIQAKDYENSLEPHIRLKRDCVGILSAFKLKDSSQHIVIVANTHLYWDPEWADVKLAQAKYLLFRLARFKELISKRYDCTPSVIVAGDFNSTPGDKVYQCLTSGETSIKQPTKPNQDLSLCSLYAFIGGEPAFTNCTPDFTGTLDYILFSNTSDLRPISFLEVPRHGSPEVKGGLPNYYHPSDHLPIGADFVVP